MTGHSQSLFRTLVGCAPTSHQRACAQALENGQSVILRAPTGSGKSEAVWIPFLSARGNGLPMRMIHTLPMRALVNQLEDRFRRYTGILAAEGTSEIRVAAMHGARPGSVLFYADAVFATLDQVVASYACAPLSISVRHGNIPAGAIPGSLLVFDEVHTFEPELGLQAVLVLARRAAEFGTPFVIMSATLPTQFCRRLGKQLNARTIDAEESDIPGRRDRAVIARVEHKQLSPEVVLHSARSSSKVLVVVNTVRRALELYQAVRDRYSGTVLLAHSRFYDEDRAAKEDQIQTLFGRSSGTGPSLLISTQVIEVGLDISCDLLMTELAPIDALIQRAGRCARWGGRGEIIIFTELETSRPYNREFLRATEAAVGEKLDGKRLSWELEKELVDKVCEERFEQWANPAAAGRVLASLAEAAFAGDPVKAEKAVRDGLPVEVALHTCPVNLGRDVLRLPRCRLHTSVFRDFVRASHPRVWRVVVDRKVEDDYRPAIEVEPYGVASKLMPGALYVIDPAFAAYDSEHGLRLDVSGSSAEPVVPGLRRKWKPHRVCFELWTDHVLRTVRCFEEIVLPQERHAFQGLARVVGKSAEELLTWMKLVLVFHDLGKLTSEWQSRIKTGIEPALAEGVFLAHRGADHIPSLPVHATVSAWLVSPYLCRLAGAEWREVLAVPSLAAIAHHHSVRAEVVPVFQMVGGWFETVERCARTVAGCALAPQHFNVTPPKGRGSINIGLKFLSTGPYVAYVLISRWLRLSDWMASGGGEHAVLRYEEWFG